MLKKVSQKIIVLMLTVFCGQVLASPLFDCCELNLTDNIAHLQMNMSAEMGMETGMERGSEMPHEMSGILLGLESMDENCNLLCVSCFYSSSFTGLESESSLLLFPALTQILAFQFSHPSSRIENLFKPPISA